MNETASNERIPSDTQRLPAHISRAFADTLAESLREGKPVRIHKLGIWTPYPGEEAPHPVAFHSELGNAGYEQREHFTEHDMNSPAIDIPFIDHTVQAHIARAPRRTPLIDVPLLFDEVCEEFGFIHLPVEMPRETPAPYTNAAEKTAPLVETMQPQEMKSAQERVPSANTYVDAPLPEPVCEVEETEPPVQEETEPVETSVEDEESAMTFLRNREQLFNPAESSDVTSFKRTGIIVTAILAMILVYLLWFSGMVNFMLPPSIQHQSGTPQQTSQPQMR